MNYSNNSNNLSQLRHTSTNLQQYVPGHSMQKKNSSLAFNGYVSRYLNKALMFVVFGVKLLLKTYRTKRKASFNRNIF